MMYWQQGDTEARDTYNKYQERNASLMFCGLLMLLLVFSAWAAIEFRPEDKVATLVISSCSLVIAAYMAYSMRRSVTSRYHAFIKNGRLIPISTRLQGFVDIASDVINDENRRRWAELTAEVRRLKELSGANEITPAQMTEALRRLGANVSAEIPDASAD